MTTPTWRNRITRNAEESPEVLTANPRIGITAVRAGRQFKLSRKLGKTHQKLLVFAKGEPPDLGETVEAGELFDNNPPGDD